jgi:hypothetical protein
MNVRGFYRPSGYGKSFIRALRNTTVDQDIQSAGLEKMAGPGDTFFCAYMGDFENVVVSFFFDCFR